MEEKCRKSSESRRTKRPRQQFSQSARHANLWRYKVGTSQGYRQGSSCESHGNLFFFRRNCFGDSKLVSDFESQTSKQAQVICSSQGHMWIQVFWFCRLPSVVARRERKHFRSVTCLESLGFGGSFKKPARQWLKPKVARIYTIPVTSQSLLAINLVLVCQGSNGTKLTVIYNTLNTGGRINTPPCLVSKKMNFRDKNYVRLWCHRISVTTGARKCCVVSV